MDEHHGAPSIHELKIDDLQRDLLLPLVETFADAAHEVASRESYLALRDALARRAVPIGLASSIGAILEVALTTGRVRSTLGPAAELSLSALFRKTPRGEAILGTLRDLNRALAKLQGSPLGEISAALRKPGVYTLTISASEYRIVLRFDRDGASVESLETGAA